jgi:hypothetical protein
MARQGKIARLPALLRKEINRRLFDGQGAPVLNAQPEAIAIWEELFEGLACSPQNLSEWKLGGYKDWRKSQDRLEDLKELSSYALSVVKAANGTLSDAAATIAAGHIVETMESIGNIVITGGTEDAEADPNKGLSLIVGGIAKLQKGDRDREASKRKDETLQLQKDRHALSREVFEKQTVKKFMEFARNPEVQALLGSRETKTVQMDKLHQMLFGDSPERGASE